VEAAEQGAGSIGRSSLPITPRSRDPVSQPDAPADTPASAAAPAALGNQALARLVARADPRVASVLPLSCGNRAMSAFAARAPQPRALLLRSLTDDQVQQAQRWWEGAQGRRALAGAGTLDRLCARFDLPAAGAVDEALIRALGEWQAAHGVAETGTAPPAVRQVLGSVWMTDAAVAQDVRWYRNQRWYSEDAMRSIQARVGADASGEADAATVRAVARFQENASRTTMRRSGRVLLTFFGDLVNVAAVGQDFKEFGLSSHSRGYVYGGRRAADFTRAAAGEFRDWAEAGDAYPDLGLGVRAFLAACPREGWPSAINTWDNMTLTWGTGFAAPAVFNQVYNRLGAETQSALTALIGGSVTLPLAAPLSPSLRTDARLLTALVHVAEAPETRLDVLRAQIETFLTHTMGIAVAGGLRVEDGRIRPSEAQPTGQRYPGLPAGVPPELANAYLLLGARLAHAGSAFNMPDEMGRAIALSGDAEDVAGTVAAFMKRFTRIFMRNPNLSQPVPAGAPRWRRSSNGQINARKWNSRLTEFRSNSGPHQIAPSSVSSRLIPALTNSSAPYLTSHATITAIPDGHWVVEDGGRFYDFGAPI
jgi:hypothetical protein